MFEPIIEVSKWLMGLIPRDLRRKKPRLNYLMVHYLYLIGWSIVGSVILYGNGYIPYNDALFFAVGCATQSGLNTINVNNLLLYQQITLMLIACVTNPIFINTGVVFVRLYWFEKRFKHIVEELRENRRNRVPTISRTKSEMRSENGLEAGHGTNGVNGVNGREIRVLHETTKPNGMSGDTITHAREEDFKEMMALKTSEDSEATPTPVASSNTSGEVAHNDDRVDGEQMTSADAVGESQRQPAAGDNLNASPILHHRDVRFADEIRPARDEAESDPDRLPEQQDLSKHIDFLARQHKGAPTLRIPGPRAFDRGEKPEELDDTESDHQLRPLRSETEREGPNTDGQDQQNADDHTQRTGIKFKAQEHPGHNTKAETEGFERSQTTASKAATGGFLDRLRRPRSNIHLSNAIEARGTFSHTFSNLSTVLSGDRDMGNDPMPYLSWQATTGRNSAFLGLTEVQREELGGIEYRSLKTLAKILIFYFIGFHLSGVLVNLPIVLAQHKWGEAVRSVGQNPTWWAFFTSASEFNDLGMTLTPTSMIPFQTSPGILLYGSFLVIIGNTGFPIMLRFVIWAASRFTTYGSQLWEELRFLLDHPRRCFTLLFPSRANWWLFWVLVLLNCIDLLFYIVLDLKVTTVTHVAPGYRVLDGWYQAVSTRTAGFAVVDLYYLHPAIQVSYLIMMYISVFPIAISVRRTNVYEEKSLGIFGGEEEGGEDEDQSYVGQHLRRQLSFDLWYIFLGLFLIAIIEGNSIQNTNEYAFTMFSVLFEIVSAYGTVGLSLGYPNTDTSFSAQFKILSKLIIMAMMLRGRHRGLPYALDRAILLPSDHLQKQEAEDAERQLHRRGSIFAEGNEAERRSSNWNQYELDENGLPRQHLRPESSATGQDVNASNHNPIARSSTNAARRTSNPTGEAEEPQRALRRIGSGMSTTSNARPRRRSKSLSRVIAGGLSAGPTFSKYD